MPSGATSQVFETVELLEMILLNISIKHPEFWRNEAGLRQLFAVQRVSKTFRDTIQGSSKLLRVMFLKHDPTSEVFDPEVNDFQSIATSNPFACSAYLYTTRGAGVKTSFMAAQGSEDGMQIIFEQGEAERSFLWKEEQYGVTPSWKKMLLKEGQPRPLWLELNWRDSDGATANQFNSMVDDQLPPGCTLGELVEYLSTIAVPYRERGGQGVDWYRTVAGVKVIEKLKAKYAFTWRS